MKAGAAGLYLGATATGKLEGDSFNLFFDPRAPELLGTPGRYYWINGKVDPNGKLKLARGETSPKLDGLAGTWRPTQKGLALELFVPYGLLEVTAWPAAGDLGFDFWWRHPEPNGGKTTHLLWCSDGHPWNTLGYGIVRLVTDPQQPLPFLLNLY
jgi:hypothetical protein